MRLYYFEIIGTAVFAVTGVPAVTGRGLDIFGAAVLGMVTAPAFGIGPRFRDPEMPDWLTQRDESSA